MHKGHVYFFFERCITQQRQPRTPAGRPTNPPILAPYLAANFPAEEFLRRVEAVRRAMRDRGMSALLVTNPENIYYLAGLNHQGYSFTLLVLPLDGDPLIVARTMERPTLDAQVPQCVQVLYADDEDPADATVRALEQCTRPGDRLAIGRSAMYFPLAIAEHIRSRLDNRSWTDDFGIVETARAIKSPAEIDLVRRAAVISDRGVRAGVDAAIAGSTERAVAAAVYHELILAGSEHPGFAPFIRSADILQHEHVTWRDRTIDRDSVLLIELSGCVYRYHAPLTRMVYVSDPPPEARAAAEVASAGMTAIKTRLAPGVATGEVYAAWQAAVDEHLGHHRYRRHHCGYTVGIGFPPSWTGGSGVVGMRPRGELVVADGMVFHALSWIIGQLPVDWCLSDTILVTSSGCEVLTTHPY